ncbi:MAG: glycoside hydrolase family 16 protein [Sedimentisphaerales bacterium]|nr:glycoside hydrolase family 16 protein [Sedimentisphaerales bacterium]
MFRCRIIIAIIVFSSVLPADMSNGADSDSRNTPTIILQSSPENPTGRPGCGFKITYRWRAAPLDKDYTVFVHFVDEDGKIVFQDDHQPLMPTSQWSGDVEYTRDVPLEQWRVENKRTVSVELPEGRYPIYAGLYDEKEGRKVLQAGPDVRQVEEGLYQIGVLTIDKQALIPGPGEKTLDLTDYHVTFNEEFDDLSVSAWGPAGSEGMRWIAHTPWRGDFGDARFTDPKPGFPFTVKDGLLRIEVRKENGRWRSGLLSAVDPNGNGFKQQYGYFECRAKFPKGPGTWPAFWLMGLKSLKGLPGNTGPRINPEIDVVEHYGHWPWRYHYVLHQWGRGGVESKHEGKRFVVFGMEEDFHTYGVMIDEQNIVLYFDGVELHRETTPESVKTPLFPLVNLALGPGWPTDKTPNPSYMYVDYVKVWKKGKGRAD